MDKITRENTSNLNKQTHYELFNEKENENENENYYNIEDSDNGRCNTNPCFEIEILNTNENDNTAYASERLKTSVNKKRSVFLFEDNREKYKMDLNNLEIKMDNIKVSIKAEFSNQAKSFEDNKRKKLERLNSKKSRKINKNKIKKIKSYKNKYLLNYN